MISIPAAALELGDLNIESSLGQPLRASIAYALNGNEQLYDFCVYLRPGLAASGLPILSRANVSVANGVIMLTGSRAIREPMLTMQVSIDCPYTAHISREYTVMINPPTPVVEVISLEASSPAPVARSSAPVAAMPRAPVQTRRNIDQSPIAPNSRYLVQRGDNAGDIVSRITDRSIALWPAVDRIFRANPDAFVDGDVNRLKTGSWLEIPDMSTAADAPMVTETVTAPETAAPSTTSTNEGSTVSLDNKAPTAAASDETVAPPVVESREAEAPLETETQTSDFSNLQPGDVVIGNEEPFVTPLGATEFIDIPDTAIVQPAPVPAVSIGAETAGKTSGSWSWLLWLGGTGLALILALLLFGQRIRQKFGSVAVGAESVPSPNRRRTDAASRAAEAADDVDFPVSDTLGATPSMSLDADFDDGSGLQDAGDMDVAQDFGFSASSTFDEELDMVLPEGAELEDDSGPTDIIEPTEREADPLVLDSEVMPTVGDDGDYDLSMIVDVTKQDVVETDATEKDLQAIQVDTVEEPNALDYTLSQDVDYKILEQDYEDEFTATQALNAEIEKAAAELSNRMDTDATGEMTAKLPENTQAVNDDINDSATNEITAEMDAAENDETVEMPSDSEVTAEMVIESGIIDTKKKKKAS